MSTQEVYAEITETLGQVPNFFQEMPEDSLVSEWTLFKKAVVRDDTAIPPKYRELIGVAVAAATQCWYCSNFHSGVAGLHGATEQEIQEAVLLAKFAAGWSTYFNGSIYDKNLFLKELGEVGAYLSK